MGVGGGVVGPPLVVWLLCGVCGVVKAPPEIWHEILGCLGQFLDLLVPKTQKYSPKIQTQSKTAGRRPENPLKPCPARTCRELPPHRAPDMATKHAHPLHTPWSGHVVMQGGGSMAAWLLNMCTPSPATSQPRKPARHAVSLAGLPATSHSGALVLALLRTNHGGRGMAPSHLLPLKVPSQQGRGL